MRNFLIVVALLIVHLALVALLFGMGALAFVGTVELVLAAAVLVRALIVGNRVHGH